MLRMLAVLLLLVFSLRLTSYFAEPLLYLEMLGSPRALDVVVIPMVRMLLLLMMMMVPLLLLVVVAVVPLLLMMMMMMMPVSVEMMLMMMMMMIGGVLGMLVPSPLMGVLPTWGLI